MTVRFYAATPSNPVIEFMLDAMRCAPVPERIDRAQLARELLAQQFEGELGHRSRRHPHPKFIVVVAPVFGDGRADVLRVHLDRAVVLKRQIYGAKLGSVLAGDFNFVAGHAALPRKMCGWRLARRIRDAGDRFRPPIERLHAAAAWRGSPSGRAAARPSVGTE